MSANSFKKILCATVSALALVTAFAPPAMAFTPMNMATVAMSSSASYNNNSNSLSLQRLDRLIESASSANVGNAARDIRHASVDGKHVLNYSNSAQYQEYATQCQKEVNPNGRISAGKVTPSLRQEFLNCLHQKEVINVAAANPQAHSFSLDSSFLAQCQSAYGVKPGEGLTHNFNQAQQTYSCVTAKEAAQDRGTALAVLAAVVGGIGLLWGGSSAYDAYYACKESQKSKAPGV